MALKRIGEATLHVDGDGNLGVHGATLLAGPDKVTVDSEANGKTLATLLGSALEDGLKVLTLVPASTGIYWAAGNASAASGWLPEGGVELNVGKAMADTLKFYAAVNTDMIVVQEG